MKELQHETISFNGFRLDLTRGCLLHGDEQVKLRPKSFEVLRHLVENHGRLVSKDELIQAVWPNTAVTDDSLVQCLIEVRRALGDCGPQIVKTVPRRGYVFDAEVIRQDSTRQVSVYADELDGVQVAIEEVDFDSDRPSTANAIAAHARPQSARSQKIGRLRSSRGTQLILACLALLLVAGWLFIFKYRATGRKAQAAPIHSLAVLPLENLSGDPAEEYFADGMTEALISNLAQIRALKVISRTSVMRYKGIRKSLPQIAQELNVDAVIEGTVQRSGGHVRVTTQLIYAATDTHLWARDYERDLTDVLKLQSEVARSVAAEIRIEVTAEERARIASARSINPQAHEAYLLGRYHLSKANEEDLKQAIEYFERATQIAPDYAAAYAGLSDAWLRRGIFGASGFKEAESPARAAALQAVRLDEQLADGHISLANTKYSFEWDWAGAEQEAKRALELDPGTIDAHICYGHLLMALERHEEAIAEGQRALQLDPMSSGSQSALGRFLHRARRFDEALPHLQRAVELEPRDAGANARLGDAYAELGRYDEAIAAYKKIIVLGSGNGTIEILIARVYALMGRQREARQMIKGVKIQPILVAGVYAELGDKDEAFKVLEKGVEERSSFLVYVKADPPLEKLHSDPRWKTLLRRMNFLSE